MFTQDQHATEHQRVVVVHIISTHLHSWKLRLALFRTKQSKHCPTDCARELTEIISKVISFLPGIACTTLFNMGGQWPRGIYLLRKTVSYLLLVWMRSLLNQIFCHTTALFFHATLKTSLSRTMAHFWGVKQVAAPAGHHSRLSLSHSHHNSTASTPPQQTSSFFLSHPSHSRPPLHSPCGPRPNCGLSSVVEMTYIR